ncbi:MAG: Fic family protein [Mycoplasmataceae bacterium]|jgi:hypothetical protein|nr:Fic family protein [Mycoplasmataceae bacterium]
MENKNKQLKKLRDLIVDFVAEAVELENLSLDYKSTYEIIYRYKQSKNKYTHNQIEAVNGALKAYTYVKETLVKNENVKFETATLKYINFLVDKYEEEDFGVDERAGEWKKYQGYVTNTEYVPPLLKGSQYSEIVEKGIKGVGNFDTAIAYFAKLCKTQAFPDGNKRSALIFTNAICVQKELPLIRIINSLEFQDELGKYYEEEKYLPKLINYIKEKSLSHQCLQSDRECLRQDKVKKNMEMK